MKNILQFIALVGICLSMFFSCYYYGKMKGYQEALDDINKVKQTVLPKPTILYKPFSKEVEI
jgi:hypothetical protein